MPIFVYKAITPQGQELVQEAVASSAEELRRDLEDKGFFLKAISPKRGPFLSWTSQKLDWEDFLQYNEELGTLLRAGLTLPEALDLSSERPGGGFLSGVLRKVLQEVKGGAPFSVVCSRYPQVFDGLYISCLRTGERTGNLSVPLLKYQDYLRQRIAIRNRISQAMVYPLFLFGVLAGVMALLFIFVMPRFALLYADSHAVLPLPTRILMGIVGRFSRLAPFLLLAAIMAFLAWRLFPAKPGGGLAGKAVRALPWTNALRKPFVASQFARTLSTLLAGGTPLVEALRVSKGAVRDDAYGAAVDRVVERVLAGESFSRSVGREDLLPRSAVKLLEVGEASGQLEGMLEEITRSSDRLLEGRVQKLMTLIEPAFILLAGLLIGTVIVVMYLPIIHLTDIVR